MDELRIDREFQERQVWVTVVGSGSVVVEGEPGDVLVGLTTGSKRDRVTKKSYV